MFSSPEGKRPISRTESLLGPRKSWINLGDTASRILPSRTRSGSNPKRLATESLQGRYDLLRQLKYFKSPTHDISSDIRCNMENPFLVPDCHLASSCYKSPLINPKRRVTLLIKKHLSNSVLLLFDPKEPLNVNPRLRSGDEVNLYSSCQFLCQGEVDLKDCIEGEEIHQPTVITGDKVENRKRLQSQPKKLLPTRKISPNIHNELIWVSQHCQSKDFSHSFQTSSLKMYKDFNTQISENMALFIQFVQHDREMRNMSLWNLNHRLLE
ncbi:unnamed protein product [Lepeophtheirus salmonis]|uniref:(salmon louse) hypothetical protein n=1 Tax=Lepeophtheirus salmonis TaxID=72036 RepID=A0A7R8H573_LEPSM|nr:unnamed protein product [Lepeophtheirus salmonis]CAF2873269.1 unnamed protein product [Lepeophtheirus salmonis]